MYKWLKDLFPLNRSLTGEGNRLTINYFKKINPELKSIKFQSNTKVFDWIIPLEWNVKDAYIKHIKSKKKYAEFKKNNLHLVGYSYPQKKIMNLNELKNKIHTDKKDQDAIPYVTSYYKKDWGFSLSRKQKRNLPTGKYEVVIDSTLTKGHLDMCHGILKGRSNKEIMFSSYICHPSMANNELSGPVLLNAIMQYIKKNYKKNYYTYRFLLTSETIGSVAYLSKYFKHLKSKVLCGYNLSCVGDERSYSHIKSPTGDNLADISLSSSLINLKPLKEYSFLHRGSDERQYCSPRINLPFCTFSKSKFGEYPEYHTSKDNLSLVTEKGLQESLDVFKNIIDAFENGAIPKNKVMCEPHLSKYNLYPTISTKNNYTSKLNTRLDLIAYSDGKRSIFQIAKLIQKPLFEINKELKLLARKKILSVKHI
jgi:aminopeptidase-like protein|tara:strand:+ start:4391 stop:5662 length:1272 start_codon:yes stop_codon:yes gene_type:complete